MTETVTAKRRIKEYRFDKPEHHIALVHSSQGGAANNYHEALVLKSTNDITDEYLEKATMVKVTLPFDDFLEKFFGMWSDNADLLTEILGFSDEEDMPEADKANMSWEDYKAECEKERQDFINSVEIMKSKTPIADMSASDFLSVMTTQSLFEAKQAEIEKAFNAAKVAPKENKNVEIEVELQKAKDEKAAVLAELETLKAANAAALQELETLKAANATAKEAARKEAIAAVVPQDQVEDLFKSFNVLDDAGFAKLIDVMKAKDTAESEVFKEKGITGGDADKPVDEDKTAAILKARYATK